MEFYPGEPQGEKYPITSWIWGHRLIIGQDAVEYALEFLNVLHGRSYQLSVGEDLEYSKRTAMGLRRLAFYEGDKSANLPNNQAYERFVDQLRLNLRDNTNVDSIATDIVGEIKRLFRSFSVIEGTRSWYAKSLFPVHEEFLFWQADKDRGYDNPPFPSPRGLDATLSYSKRNFFARGGELYYLLLSLGCEVSSVGTDLRRTIENELRYFLLEANPELGQLARVVSRTWHDLDGEPAQDPPTGTLAFVPKVDTFAKQIAGELARFLQSSRRTLDSLETMNLLSLLVAFHVCQFIFVRAHAIKSPDKDPKKMGELLVDCLVGSHEGPFHQASATTFRTQETAIVDATRTWLRQRINSATHSIEQLADSFNIKAKTGMSSEALLEEVEKNMKKDFHGVARKLAKTIGFVVPKTGPGARFTLAGDLLKTLVLAITPPEGMEYSLFLGELYTRYALVVGPNEAREAMLMERFTLSVEYYERNKAALLSRLVKAGLAVQYSDATAIVRVGGFNG